METSVLLGMETVQQMKEYIETTSVISRVIEVLIENLGNPDDLQ